MLAPGLATQERRKEVFVRTRQLLKFSPFFTPKAGGTSPTLGCLDMALSRGRGDGVWPVGKGVDELGPSKDIIIDRNPYSNEGE